MTTLHFHQTTTSTPAQFIARLTDFGPGRSEVFPNSADEYLEVHDQGPDWADVSEGSKGTWERLHYDWSHADRVVLTTTESNAWSGESGHTYTLTRNSDGTTDVALVSVRDGKNFKGRFFAVVFAVFGTWILGPAFENSVNAIERRNAHRNNDSGSDSTQATRGAQSRENWAAVQASPPGLRLTQTTQLWLRSLPVGIGLRVVASEPPDASIGESPGSATKALEAAPGATT